MTCSEQRQSILAMQAKMNLKGVLSANALNSLFFMYDK